jgi:hypothetical protein
VATAEAVGAQFGAIRTVADRDAVSSSTNREADNIVGAVGVQPGAIFASMNHAKDVVAGRGWCTARRHLSFREMHREHQNIGVGAAGV